MWNERIIKHITALIILLAILFLSGCMAPAASQPAAGGAAQAPAAPAANAGSAAASSRPAATHSEAAAPASGGAAAPAHSNQYEAVTAGVTDDNEGWNDYLAYRSRHQGEFYIHDRDVSERYVIQVIDENSLPVHDATVEVYAGGQVVFTGRTDAGGQMLFHPRALDENYQLRSAGEFRVVAKKGYVAQSHTFARNGSDHWLLTLTSPARADYTQLDLVFLIDATGSMGDEIDKLKASMADVADQIAKLPAKPDVRYGLVAYRDRGDEFVVRPYDFTYNLNDFQRNLAALRADGGGDTPESLNEALRTTLNNLSWRNDNTVRLIILVADAPPHLDYGEAFSYDNGMIEMVQRGIKIFPVGASNLEGDGEYIFRQMAQFTGGKFVFLTYKNGDDPSSGPGTETNHDVDNYSVDTLDKLVVRLVREELAKLTTAVKMAAQPVVQQQPSPVPTPTAQPPVQPVSCTLDLAANRNDCGSLGGVTVLEQQGNQTLLRLTLDPRSTGYTKARFDVSYGNTPSGLSVNIGDSLSNGGYGGDNGNQSNNAEVQIENNRLSVYGNDYTQPGDTIDGKRQLKLLRDVVRSGETISLEVSNEHLGINTAGGIEVVNSSDLFALNGQEDRRGSVNYDLYAAFNRNIAGTVSGSGVTQVVVTLYPAR
ncbi:MAG: vWA domain-containing protein [Caldilineaceae bacterium]